MLAYIEATERRMSLFDAPLQANFFRASKENEHYDLRTVLDGTLVEAMPELAVNRSMKSHWKNVTTWKRFCTLENTWHTVRNMII
jgi:hypothetical protein